jgi:predicted nucleic-acid-binding protein
MRAVDANVLVRLVTRDDAKQVSAAEDFVAKGAWVPQLALAEATGVLATVYGLGAREIATAVEMLLNHEHLAVQDADAAEAALAHYRRRPAVGFSDCLLLEISRKSGHVPVGTFDRAFAKLEGTERP